MRKGNFKRFFPALVILGVFISTSNLSAGTWEIHTFGGGELLTSVFNMVKLILYGNSKTGLGAAFAGFTRIICALGAVSCVVMIIYKQSPGFIFKSFLLPAFFILNVLLLPRTSIVIHDDAIRNSTTTQVSSISVVNDVPFLYGAFLSLLSELSYGFTKLLEQCTHQVNDQIYNWTGRIYAGEYALRLKTGDIFNKDFETNFREFCRSCVWNDLERGLYSRKDLIQSNDLLGFLKERTSSLNTVNYQSFDQDNGGEREFLTCREAISTMSGSLASKNALQKAGSFIQNYLPTSTPTTQQALQNSLKGQLSPQESDLNFLLGKSQANSLSNLRSQSGIIQILKEELPGTQASFTARRAEAQNRVGMKTTGAIAASTLVTMKNVFEALIYFSFPLVCLFSLVPGMYKLFLSWLKACIWIATLAPFYVIINSILMFIWNKKKELMFGLQTDLTLSTYDGLVDLYDSMEAISALAIGSIFTISLLLTRSGFEGLSHALPSMFSSGQSAAQSAAAETVSGNYSFGNVSLDNAHAHNYDAFKQNYGGSFSQDVMSVNEGSQSMTYDLSNDEMYLHQENSRLRDSISQTDTFSSSVQNQLSSTETAVQEESSNFLESASDSANHAVGMMEAYGMQKQQGHTLSSSESSGANQTFQEIDNLAQEYSKTHNVSYDNAIREMVEVGAKIPLLKTGFSIGGSESSQVSDANGQSERYSQAETFTNLIQKASNFSSSEIGNVLNTSDSRKHEDFSQSWNKTASLSDQLRASYSQQESLSQLQGDLQSDNVSVNRNLDQQFVNYVSDQYDGDVGLVNKTLNAAPTDPGKKQHIDNFVASYKPAPIEGTAPSVQDSYRQSRAPIEKAGAPLQGIEAYSVAEEVVGDLHNAPRKIDHQLERLQQKGSDPQISSQKQKLTEDGAVLQKESDEASHLKNFKKSIPGKLLGASMDVGSKLVGSIVNKGIHHYGQEDKE